MNLFEEKLQSLGLKLKKSQIKILQVNLGKLCNLACIHCHVEAGPTRHKENMVPDTAKAVHKLMDSYAFQTVDITGGAPELNPNFKPLVQEARKRDLHVIDRCNLTVFFEEGMQDLPQFLRDYGVEVIASMPCYLKENVDQQRGRGTYDGSVEALKILNRLGYGVDGSGLILNLVYNPVGPDLPPNQYELEKDYKTRFLEDHGIIFNHLYTLTNMPITRYAKYLKVMGDYERYVHLLHESFNAETLPGLMCRDTLSVGWDGRIYDCDFNQMLGIQIHNGKPLTIFDLDPDLLDGMEILTADHCFGCTAGSGSSCQGALKVMEK